MTRKPAKETDLFAPLRDYLEANGYAVRAEVGHCDVVAVKDDELVMIELKRQFGVDLLMQATARQRATPSVYAAFPAPAKMGRNSRWPGIKRLLRQLELGCILFFLDGPAPRVEVAFHPTPYQRRVEKRARRAVIREAAQRSANYNEGGSTGRKLVTAYRENAVFVACCLDRLGPSKPKTLRALGTGPKTTPILSSNFYGWFERVDRGVYALSAQGRRALEEYADIAARCRGRLDKQAEDAGA